MKFFSLFALLLAVSVSVSAADSSTSEKTTKLGRSIWNELRQYGHDAKDLTLAPLRWNEHQWLRFGEGVAAAGAVYAADRPLYDAVQRNRSSFTDNYAKVVTPFGGQRALQLSALLIVAGSMTHDFQMRDAGRDSLESELWAAGVVTPLLKRAFGRARPIQELGTHSFHPGSSKYQSFPSGHSTNVFALATAVAGHYDTWVVPTIVYTLATSVAFSRVNDRAHFPSDVLAGALISRAVAKGIVARHQRGRIAWDLAPAMVNGRTAVTAQLRYTLGP